MDVNKVMRKREPFNMESLRPRPGQCFICEFVRGAAAYQHAEIARTEISVAFMNKYPTLEGYVLVAPIEHLEQVTGDFSEASYIEVQRFVYRVAEAVRKAMQPERLYILSLGSQAANSHVHWHIAPLPPGVPLEQQQYYALMHEHGALAMTEAEVEATARSIRQALQGD